MLQLILIAAIVSSLIRRSRFYWGGWPMMGGWHGRRWYRRWHRGWGGPWFF